MTPTITKNWSYARIRPWTSESERSRSRASGDQRLDDDIGHVRAFTVIGQHEAVRAAVGNGVAGREHGHVGFGGGPCRERRDNAAGARSN